MQDYNISYAGNNGAPPAMQIQVRNDSVIQYLPNADFQLWITPLLKRGALCLALTPFLLIFLGYVGLLTPIMAWAVNYLRLFKYFLTSNEATSTLLWLNYVKLVTTPIFLALGGGLAYLVWKYGGAPNAIALTKAGMVFGKRVQNDKVNTILRATRIIRWEKVREVKIIRPTNTRSNRDYCLEFHELGGTPVRLRIGDVVNPNDRQAFLNFIKGKFSQWISDESLQVFIPPRDRQSYTELWLAELSAPPKRDRLTPLEVGARVNNQKYEVLSKLGVGGQGTVYLAGDISTGGAEVVVLKEFVLPVFPDTGVRKAAAIRFQDEANLLTKLDHPQIVKLKELFLEDHRAYLVLQHLTGRNLKDLVAAEGKMPTAQILGLARQMCEILVYLHGQSPPVVHRDFTPDNLILDETGFVQLIDFSVAQTFTSNVTGSVVGKPHYIAPEQFRGKPTIGSDLYSMGATLFYLATGLEPEPITNLRLLEYDEDADPKLAAIIERATKLDVAARYGSAGEVLQQLL